MNGTDAAQQSQAAAFFDVDGTIVDSTIVHYYAWMRRRRMSKIAGQIWYGAFLVKCLHYLWLDRQDRTRLNEVFYQSYRGLPSDEIESLAHECFETFIEPRVFDAAVRCIHAHQEVGRKVVLVTGSLDFLMAPLGRHLDADRVIATKLVSREGAFTGELEGKPLVDDEKARRVRQFAQLHTIDLQRSYAYGDSISDVPVLSIVGHPQAVNPDARLRKHARDRGWAIHPWKKGKELEVEGE